MVVRYVYNIDNSECFVHKEFYIFFFQLILKASEPIEILVVDTVIFRPVTDFLEMVHLQSVEFRADVICKHSDGIVIDDFEKFHIDLLIMIII